MVDNSTLSAEQRTQELARIRAGMIRQDYYLMHRRPAAPERKAAVLLEHFQWLVAMEKAGHILMTGALFDQQGRQGEGLTLLRAQSWQDAQRLAATDPFVMTGAVSFAIERWLLGAGHISLSVDLSDQRVTLS